MLQNIQKIGEQAGRRKGQLVRDHPPPEMLILRQNMSRMSLANRFANTRGQTMFSTSQVPPPYEPCILPASELKSIAIADLQLETHHRGFKVMVRVLTEPSRMSAIMTIVEDAAGTAVLLQLYQQAPESVIPASEVVPIHGVCILKEPFFKCATDGSYGLRVDHVSDILWLNDTDERIPRKWRKPQASAMELSSSELRQYGNDHVMTQKWAEAHRL